MKIISHLVLTLVIGFLFTTCKEEAVEKVEIIRPVTFVTIGKIDVQERRTFSGVAAAANEIELSFRGNGIITILNAKVGQRVRKGQLIAKLDNVEATLAHEQSISAVNAAKSGLNTAQSSLDRSKALYERGSQALSEYEAARNSYQSALDQFESAVRNQDIKESQISYGYIYAPRDGIVAAKHLSLNEQASSGQVVVVLISGNKIKLEVGIPGNVINDITLAMETDITFTALDSGNFKGRVTEVAPIVDVNASIFPVKIDILNPSSAIRPGMVADVTFALGSISQKGADLLTVPVKSVGEDGDGNFVFTIESVDEVVGTVKKQTITLGELTNAGFVVESGLTEGQKIATAGLQSLLDGQKVRLQ